MRHHRYVYHRNLATFGLRVIQIFSRGDSERRPPGQWAHAEAASEMPKAFYGFVGVGCGCWNDVRSRLLVVGVLSRGLQPP